MQTVTLKEREEEGADHIGERALSIKGAFPSIRLLAHEESEVKEEESYGI